MLLILQTILDKVDQLYLINMASSAYYPPGGGGGAAGGNLGANLGSQLPRLAMETELQKLLADEKAIAERHKINYQQLKVEHTKLQDQIIDLESENKAIIEETRIVKDKYLTMYEACKRDLAEKIVELEELKMKMITPQRLELIRTQVAEEVENTWREKTKKHEAEVEEYRSSTSRLRYELSFLKSEYEHDTAEHQQRMEEMTKQHDLELRNLRQDRDSAIAKIQAETSQDTQKVRILQRENAQLHLQVKELLVELEEIRAMREKSGLDADNISRTQTKQISEHQATIRSLEAERESLKRQLDNAQRELMATTTEHNKLKGEIHELEKKNTILKGHAEEVIHRSKVDLSDLKMDMLKQRGELEKERDRLNNDVEDLRSQVDIAESKVRQLQGLLEDKEREAVQRVQAAREEEFAKMARVENDKFELETKLQEMERRRIDDEGRHHADQEKNQERLSQANAAKDQAERELIGVKTRLAHMESLHDQLERERSENSSLKSRIHKLETDLGTFQGAESDLTESNMRLKTGAELAREEAKAARAQLEQLQNNHEVILLQQKSAMADDRSQLEMRVHELEDKLSQAQSRYNHASAIHKKLKKKNLKMSEHFKEKLLLMEAQNEELNLEKKALQKCIPADQHNRLRKQWKELWRRHQEFRTILFSVPSEISKTGFSYSSVRASKAYTMDSSVVLNKSTFDNEMEEQHQEDLKVLRLRLEALNNVQNQQLAQLADLDPKPRPALSHDPNSDDQGNTHSPELTPREKQDPEKGLGREGSEGAVMCLADLS